MAATAIDLQPYASLNDEDCAKRINHSRPIPVDRVVILGDHYQRDETFKPADFSGDSLKLPSQVGDLQHQARVFENRLEGNAENEISVPLDVANYARVAVQPMLAIQDKPGYWQ
ncbi:quinolinate synthase NadA [Gammaproteobacteria bacterium]|nr:quinolinate synthase NadA [Gammaproteobacteria bacterium]